MPNQHSTLTGLFTDIASAIREKDGSTSPIVADAFPSAIRAIPTGGGGGGDSLFGRKAVTGSVTFVSQTPSFLAQVVIESEDLVAAMKDEFPGVQSTITKFYTKDGSDSFCFWQFLNAAYMIDPDSVRTVTDLENAGGITLLKDHSTRKFIGAKVSSGGTWSYPNISKYYGVLQHGLTLIFEYSVGYGMAGSKYNWIIWCDEHGEVVS